MAQITPLENTHTQPNHAMIMATFMQVMLGTENGIGFMSTEEKEQMRRMLDASLGNTSSGKRQKMNTGLSKV